MRKAALAGLLLAALLGSFFVTLKLLDTGAPPSTAEIDQSDAGRLASRSVSDRSELIEAAVGMGLHASARMRGSVDAIKRIDESKIAIAGWLVDPNSEGEFLDVIVFIAGKKGGMTQTRGERPDVTKALGLSAGAEKNVAFHVSSRCKVGDQLVIVGVGTDKQYLYLSSARCP